MGDSVGEASCIGVADVKGTGEERPPWVVRGHIIILLGCILSSVLKLIINEGDH